MAAAEERVRVLIVDDSVSTRMIARATIERLGLEVVEAATGAAALEHFARGDISLILLDVGLPDLDGFEVAERMRASEKGTKTPIIMLTGRDDVESIQRAFEVGATDFASKPVSWLILGHRLLFILESTRREREIVAQREQLEETQRRASIGSWAYRASDRRLELSASCREIFDLPATGDVLEVVLQRVLEADRERLGSTIEESFTGDQPVEMKHRWLDASGREHVIYTSARRAVDPVSGEAWIRGLSQDITVREQAEERIRFLSHHDRLTGLKNLESFRESLSILFAEQKRDARGFALMWVKIDRFARLNERQGRGVADAILCATADRLVQTVRNTDIGAAAPPLDATIARVGVDEFSVALANVSDPAELARIAVRLIEAVREPIFTGSEELVVTAHVGIAIAPEDGDELGALMANADAANRHAREVGRRHYEFYRASMNEAARSRLSLEHDFRQALLQREIEVYYQPRIDMATGAVVGAEALSRWQHESRGWIPPEEFVRLAEEAGLTFEFGRGTIESVMEQMRDWRVAGHTPLSISLNVSPTLLVDERLPQLLLETMEIYDIDPSRIEIEITESVLIRREEDAAAALGKLKALGLSIALDDFGTGYSALSHLQYFQVDVVKIDRSFVTALNDDRGRAIVRGVISMAHAMDLRVVAEGVEELAQRAFLVEAGCDEEQGFLISKPVSASRFEELFMSVSVRGTKTG